MQIAVLGGGNGSFAAAGDFALAGHAVWLWRRDQAAVAAQQAGGNTIVVKDFQGRRPGKLAAVTNDIGAAVRGADLILRPVPATAHHDIARLLAPHLSDGQVVYLPPGTFGAVLFAKATHDAGNRAKAAFAETGTLPWLTRKHAPFVAAITARAKRLPTGVFPLIRKDHALSILRRAFPNVIEDCGDALSGSLMNAGPIIHPPLIIMNAGPLQHFHRWDIHKEGTQPAIRRVTDALDAERIALREALDYGPPHFPLAHHYAKEWMYGRGSHDRLTDSGDWREHVVLTEHRYMLEDVRIGLSFLLSVAALAGVAMPLVRAVLSIGAAICGQDFMATGRTLAGSVWVRWIVPAYGACCGRALRDGGPADRLPRRRPDGAWHRRRLCICRTRCNCRRFPAAPAGGFSALLWAGARRSASDARKPRLARALSADGSRRHRRPRQRRAASGGAGRSFDGSGDFRGRARGARDQARCLGARFGARRGAADHRFTTSTILADDRSGAINEPRRFLNAHWLNPAYLVPLVELSPFATTDPTVTERLKQLLESIGKVPVVCAARPGYIVPRIQALAMNEAARMVEEGVASAADIDKAIKYGFGFRFAVLGMLEFIDWGGGDILYYASRYLTRALNDPRYAAPEIIERNMREGHIGLTTGKGFLDYSSLDREAYRAERLKAFIDMLKFLKLVRPPMLPK